MLSDRVMLLAGTDPGEDNQIYYSRVGLSSSDYQDSTNSDIQDYEYDYDSGFVEYINSWYQN